jgi:hypothetical protein
MRQAAGSNPVRAMATRLSVCLAVAADFVWKSVRGGLVALALGALAVFGGRGLADAGVPTIWLWLWGIFGFVGFAGGLAFWAMSASKRWAVAAAATQRRSARTPAARPAMVSADRDPEMAGTP